MSNLRDDFLSFFSVDTRILGGTPYFFVDNAIYFLIVLASIVVILITTFLFIKQAQKTKSFKIWSGFTVGVIIGFQMLFLSSQVVTGTWLVTDDQERQCRDSFYSGDVQKCYKSFKINNINNWISATNKIPFIDKYNAGFLPTNKKEVQIVEALKNKTPKDYDNLARIYWSGLNNLPKNYSISTEYRKKGRAIIADSVRKGKLEYVTTFLSQYAELNKASVLDSFVANFQPSSCSDVEVVYELIDENPFILISGFSDEQKEILKQKNDAYSIKHCIPLYNKHF